MTTELPAAITELAADFAMLGPWTERYQYIIELGQQLPAFPAEKQNDAFLVKGCLSQVWMCVEQRQQRLYFQATSDSAIVCGLIAILLRVYNGLTADEVLQQPLSCFDALELQAHLSPTRNNGLHLSLIHI